MYSVVEDVFNDSDFTSISSSAYPVLAKINGQQFVQEAAHQLEDMLI